MSQRQPPSIDVLLRLVPDSPQAVLQHLRSHRSLASASDENGYSLLHAAASYNQLDLLRALVKEYGVNPNDIEDTEGETPIFAAETVAAVKCLVEELGADPTVLNEEGTSVEDNARENVEEGGEWLAVAEYIAGRTQQQDRNSETLSEPDSEATQTDERQHNQNNHHAPPPLPPGIRITGMRTLPEGETGIPEADPEFRRRIEQLAARDDFQGEEGQRELKKLVEDAVGDLKEGGGGSDAMDEGRDVRRRID